MKSPWLVLESIHNLSAVTAEWRTQLGAHFAAFRNGFLVRAAQAATSYPCPRQCGCAHEIVHHNSIEIVAVCRCESWNCDDLRLAPQDTALWTLSWPRLGSALCKALGLHSRKAGFTLENTRQIGAWSEAAIPVILTVQSEPSGLRPVIRELAARLRQPFILLAPTARHLDATGKELLAHAGAGFFDLESHITFQSTMGSTALVSEPDDAAEEMATGILRAIRSPADLFGRFTPQPAEPVEEDVARRAFALVQQLDSDESIQAPTVLTVFRLYCMEDKSISQIAQKFRCSKATVFRRLELIRAKTGMDPRDLRKYSAHLEHIEEDIADSRAAHIHRKNLIEERDEGELR